MAIQAIGGGNTPYVPKAQSGGDEAGSLQRQKQALEKELDALKSAPKNSQAQQDAAVNKKEMLEKQIADIDKKLQSLSKDSSQGQNSSKTAAAKNSEKTKTSKSNSLSSLVKSEHSTKQEENSNSQSKDLENVGHTIDSYA